MIVHIVVPIDYRFVFDTCIILLQATDIADVVDMNQSNRP